MSSSPAPAPIRVFISYSHDSPEHIDRVLSLADRLTQDGIAIALDQYENPPPPDWRLWMENQMEEAALVLIICTENYFNRVRQKVKPGEGKGVKWEALLAYQEIYDNDSLNPKFIPVLLEGGKYSDIPKPLRGGNFYDLSAEKGYDDLYWRITNQPAAIKPKRGEIKKRLARQKPEINSTPAAKTKPENPWNVPHERNDVFTGRDEILTQLREDLLKKNKQALSGLGGIGKTQIAVEYAYRHEGEYRAVLWTFADSEQSINTGFANIAKLLELPEKDNADQAVIVEAVKRWLQENAKWLLVFDNADSPAILSKFLPQQPRGHILVTSRAYAFQNLGILQPREVSVLNPTAALEFLLKRTAREGTVESREAEALAKELGYLPLALEQAAAYIVENQSSFKDYLASYQKQRLKLLEKQGPALGNSQEQQKRTVASAWAVNFEDVENNSPASADLLHLCAFLAPDAIPLELLERGGAVMGGRLAPILARATDDLLVVDELLKPLTSYSLVRRNPEGRSFSIHPLVQEATCEGMTLETQRLWAERTVSAVDAAFPLIKFESWADCERLLAHALRCASLIDFYKLDSGDGAHLLHQAGFYLRERAQYAQAEPLHRQALMMAEKLFGPEHPFTVTSLENLSLVYHGQGKYEQAARLNERSLAVREKILGGGHPDVATSLNNLAGVYDDQGRYSDAEPLYKRALDIRLSKLGSKHRDTASSLNNLASFYCERGRYAEAEPLFEQALSIWLDVQGPEHPVTLTGINNLSALYRGLGDYKKAQQLCLQVLQIRERVLGSKHPDTAQSVNNLAWLNQEQGKHQEAEVLYRRAHEIQEETLGELHPDALSTLHNLAGLYQDQERYAESENLYQLVLAARETALGRQHPETRASRANLATVYRAQGKFHEAEALEQRAGS